jgi:predicted transcriptional regulator
MRITVDLPESQIRRLVEAARRLDVSVESLAAAAIQDFVARDDAEFAKVAERIVKRNSDL